MRSYLIVLLLLCSDALMAYQFISVGSGGVSLPLHGHFFSYGAKPSSRNEIEISGYVANHNQGNVIVDYRYYAVRYKRFLSRSLYYAPGFGQRMVRGRLDLEDDNLIANRNIDSYGAELSFGNLWTNGKFRFAVDWLGYYHPLMSTTTQSRYRVKTTGKNYPLTSGPKEKVGLLKNRLENEWNGSVWNRMTETGNFVFMRLQFGYIF